ncbi:hypothetical protein FB451DRAFT_1265463 [Mycena latifolia]|nr:hypothetical protein FB451DRAFT_1265463 [Mycena latifolia]
MAPVFAARLCKMISGLGGDFTGCVVILLRVVITVYLRSMPQHCLESSLLPFDTFICNSCAHSRSSQLVCPCSYLSFIAIHALTPTLPSINSLQLIRSPRFMHSITFIATHALTHIHCNSCTHALNHIHRDSRPDSYSSQLMHSSQLTRSIILIAAHALTTTHALIHIHRNSCTHFHRNSCAQFHRNSCSHSNSATHALTHIHCSSCP